jgi:hypothetical protein
VWTFLILIIVGSSAGLLILWHKVRAEKHVTQAQLKTLAQSEQSLQYQPPQLQEQLQRRQQVQIPMQSQELPPQHLPLTQSSEPQQGSLLCSTCGAIVSVNAKFCVSCGSPIQQ